MIKHSSIDWLSYYDYLLCLCWLNRRCWVDRAAKQRNLDHCSEAHGRRADDSFFPCERVSVRACVSGEANVSRQSVAHGDGD